MVVAEVGWVYWSAGGRISFHISEAGTGEDGAVRAGLALWDGERSESYLQRVIFIKCESDAKELFLQRQKVPVDPPQF